MKHIILDSHSNKMKDHLMLILKTDSSRLIADIATNEVGNNPVAFHHIWDFSLNKPYPVNMRASRVLSLCAEKYPELMNPYLVDFTQTLISEKTEGVKRNLLKIATEKLPLHQLHDIGILIDYCFQLILNYSAAYAYRVYAMEVIYRSLQFEPAFKQELQFVLENLPEDSPISIKSRAKNILKKLKK